jgi:cytosine/adenosine deaminase-related metal-dependent hydrolase
MRTLIRELTHIATFDEEGREFADADILVDGRVIADIGPGLPDEGVNRVVDGRGLVALPGLINAHQHVWQLVSRSIPDFEYAEVEPIIGWVAIRPTEWWREGRFTPDSLRALARAAFAESLLGGVTTVADQHLFFPGDPETRGATVEPWMEGLIEAAAEVGIRLHAGRGTTTRGPDEGGPSHGAVLKESLDTILAHCQQLIERYHDPDPLARIRIDLAPSGVHLDGPEVFAAFLELADDHPGVGLHTHLYEVMDDIVSREVYGVSPWRFLQAHGWARDRVWVAHANAPPDEEIPEIAAAGVGVVHVITGDLRLLWGLAPIRRYREEGVKLGFGTTGASVAEAAHLLPDLRAAYLAHRVPKPPPDELLTVRDVFAMATRGSAACLGRTHLGSLAPGKAADIACWDTTTVDRVGVHDPLMSLLLGGLSHTASLVLVDGDVLVEDGRPTHLDLDEIARTARAAVPMD